MFENPDFAKMAEQIGSKLLSSDPNMKAMMESMADPKTQEQMKARMERLKEDPECADLLKEIEQGGPMAMAQCVSTSCRWQAQYSCLLRHFSGCGT
jgi:hypothetical protein